jgi:hypothetical protein
MQHTYKIMKGANDIVWVTVNPLMTDIKQAMEDLVKIDISTLTEQDTKIFNLKILGLKTVYEFLGAIVQEQTLADLRTQYQATINLNTTDQQKIGILH